MILPGHSRRDFLSTSGATLGGLWLLGLLPRLESASLLAAEARRGGLPFATFTPREAADFEALAARIIPTDDTPGAREAGAVYFADKVLGDLMAEALPPIREGLADLDRRASSAFPGGGGFAALPEARQDEIVGAVEREAPAFLGLARMITALSMATHPQWGGNRDEVGWRLMGFQPYFAHQPPFGHYDRNEHGAGEDGA